VAESAATPVKAKKAAPQAKDAKLVKAEAKRERKAAGEQPVAKKKAAAKAEPAAKKAAAKKAAPKKKEK
jgi:histone H1/5